jgi:hypothetical protein
VNLTPAQRHARLLVAYRAALLASGSLARGIASGEGLSVFECETVRECIDRALVGFESMDDLADDLPHVPGADRRRVDILLGAGKP